MPPKTRLSKEQVVTAATELVRNRGISALNARALAAELSCSTQPIFSNFSSMEELRTAVGKAAFSRYIEHIESAILSAELPPYKASGMAYISFAVKEPKLFELLFMSNRGDSTFEWDPMTRERIIPMIMNGAGLSREEAELLHLELWVWVHGMAVMLATSYLKLDWAQVSSMLSDVYFGLLGRKENLK